MDDSLTKPLPPLTPPLPPQVAVVGAGYWGKNLIRNMASLNALGAVCEPHPQNQAWVNEHFPQVSVFSSVEALLQAPHIAGVCIATPSHTHAPLGQQVLAAGKALYVEKPLATTVPDAEALVRQAEILRLPLMVGHLLLYHPVVHRMGQLLQEGALGTLQWVSSSRCNVNVGRNDRNVIWDLLPHDLSVLCYLLQDEHPRVLHSIGHRTGTDGKIDHATATLAFAGQAASEAVPVPVNVQVQASWVSPAKQVELCLLGSQGALVWNDTLPLAERLQWRERNASGYAAPTPVDVLPLEPLRLECQHFINTLAAWQQGGESPPMLPLSHGGNGLAIVSLLEAIEAQAH